MPRRKLVNEDHVMSLTVAGLKKLCKKHKIPTKGLKLELQENVLQHLNLGKYAPKAKKTQGRKRQCKPGKSNVEERLDNKAPENLADLTVAPEKESSSKVEEPLMHSTIIEPEETKVKKNQNATTADSRQEKEQLSRMDSEQIYENPRKLNPKQKLERSMEIAGEETPEQPREDKADQRQEQSSEFKLQQKPEENKQIAGGHNLKRLTVEKVELMQENPKEIKPEQKHEQPKEIAAVTQVHEEPVADSNPQVQANSSDEKAEEGQKISSGDTIKKGTSAGVNEPINELTAKHSEGMKEGTIRLEADFPHQIESQKRNATNASLSTRASTTKKMKIDDKVPKSGAGKPVPQAAGGISIGRTKIQIEEFLKKQDPRELIKLCLKLSAENPEILHLLKQEEPKPDQSKRIEQAPKSGKLKTVR